MGGHLKHAVIFIIIALQISACAVQPTATQVPTDTPTPLTAQTSTATPSPTTFLESELPYEQQKTLIENRFEQSSRAFEALIKEDGNLEYYNGAWHTLEAMRNLNGEIIPWGESYEMASEEGQKGILTNIMAGNQEFMDEWIQTFNNANKNVEGNGVGSSNANLLFVQFFPDANSMTKEREGKEIYHYDMKGQIIVKNHEEKIYVIDVNTFLSLWSVVHVFVKNEEFFGYDIEKLYEKRAIENCYLGLQNQNLLNYSLGGFIQYADEPNEKLFLEKVMNSSMENFKEKIETNPNLIGDDLYHIHWLIYPNY